MDVRGALYRALEITELWRQIFKVCDPLRLSIKRQSDIRRRTIRMGWTINIVEFEEMNGRESCNQIMELIGRDS